MHLQPSDWEFDSGGRIVGSPDARPSQRNGIASTDMNGRGTASSGVARGITDSDGFRALGIAPSRALAEIAVSDGVPDGRDLVVRVERWRGPTPIQML